MCYLGYSPKGTVTSRLELPLRGLGHVVEDDSFDRVSWISKSFSDEIERNVKSRERGVAPLELETIFLIGISFRLDDFFKSFLGKIHPISNLYPPVN